MPTIDEVRVENVSSGEVWLTHEIAEESAGRFVVLVGSDAPPLSFFGPDDRYVIRGRIGWRLFESPPLELDASES
ncbi:MAG TPA: hypothetical protein VN605_04680, partial [Thermoanaerobaculia bacterium]|nr:hypothetical protein [Thermoanaerobaculia bacterium]